MRLCLHDCRALLLVEALMAEVKLPDELHPEPPGELEDIVAEVRLGGWWAVQVSNL